MPESSIIEQLRKSLPAHCVLSSREELRPYECDGLSAYRNLPLAVVIPETLEQVRTTLQLCASASVPVVARGAGTGLSGGALPVVPIAIALVLVILVVFIFIQDWRAALIPTIAIPVSLIGAFIVFPLIGFTVNVLSLLGLFLAIGIVVDDAIVVVEAVQVNIENGMNAKEATIHAMEEVTAPVVATTLVLMAVFVPVAFIPGMTGMLYNQFALTIAMAVGLSAFNSLTLSPALCSLLLKEPKPYKGLLGKFFASFNKWMGKTTDGYMSYTNVITGKLKRGVIFILVLTLGAGVFGSLVPGGFIPEEDMGYFFVNIQLPNAASLQRTNEISSQVEEILLKYPEVEYVTNATGYSLLSGAMAPNNGFMFVTLKEWGEREATAKEIINRLNVELATTIKGAQAFAFGKVWFKVPPTMRIWKVLAVGGGDLGLAVTRLSCPETVGVPSNGAVYFEQSVVVGDGSNLTDDCGGTGPRPSTVNGRGTGSATSATRPADSSSMGLCRRAS